MPKLQHNLIILSITTILLASFAFGVKYEIVSAQTNALQIPTNIEGATEIGKELFERIQNRVFTKIGSLSIGSIWDMVEQKIKEAWTNIWNTSTEAIKQRVQARIALFWQEYEKEKQETLAEIPLLISRLWNYIKDLLKR